VTTHGSLPPVTPAVDRPAPEIAQQTAPEIHVAAQAAADGTTGRHWRFATDDLAMIYERGERNQHSVRLVGEPMLDLLRLPLTLDALRVELHSLGGLTGVLQLHVMIGTALASQRANVAFSIDDLIRAIGLDPRSAAERQRERQRVWARVLLLEHLEVIGERRGRYKDRTTKKVIAYAMILCLLVPGALPHVPRRYEAGVAGHSRHGLTWRWPYSSTRSGPFPHHFWRDRCHLGLDTNANTS